MQLKECPFCGSQARMQYDGHFNKECQVVCSENSCILNEYNLWWDTEEDAAEEWNRRSPSGS